jgi:iron-sulfur cluster assembly accessory protein
MLQISQAAAVHLRSLVPGNSPERSGLRVYVEKGGCAGLQYEMKIDQVQEGDSVSERDGVCVMVDEASRPFLAGAELDYCDDLTGTGFRIVNPNATRSCGCGTSFEPAPTVEQSATEQASEQGLLRGLVGATARG